MLFLCLLGGNGTHICFTDIHIKNDLKMKSAHDMFCLSCLSKTVIHFYAATGKGVLSSWFID